MKASNAPTPFFFVAVMAALFLAIFYNTVTNMAGLYIVSDLGGGTSIAVYPMVFFGLGSGVSIPFSNPLADRIGTIRTIVLGLILYAISSLLSGAVPTFFLFNLCRFILGFALGPIYILARRLIVRFAPPGSESNFGFLMILFFTTVPVLGACYGGWMAYETHWRWIFHIEIPIAVLLIGYFWFGYRDLDLPTKKADPFDWIGYLSFALSVTLLVTAATVGQQIDWVRSSLWNLLFFTGLPLFCFFIHWELICPYPVLNLRLLKNRMLSFSLINLAVLFSAYFGMIILIAQWLNIYAHYTPLWIDAILGSMLISAGVAYLLCKRLIDRVDLRLVLGLSIIAFALSCYYSSHFNIHVDLKHLTKARLLAGVGLILFLFPLIRFATTWCKPEQTDQAFTQFLTVRSLFSSLGAGVYIILWQRREAFYHSRLGEQITLTSQLTRSWFQEATEVVGLSRAQATEQLNLLLTDQASSLGLNDTLGAMGYICVALLCVLVLSFAFPGLLSSKDVAEK